MTFRAMTSDRILLLVATAVLSTQAMAGVGFLSGNNFRANLREGRVSVTCFDNGTQQTLHQTCSADVLSPKQDQYVTVGVDTSADTITLVVNRADGSIRRQAGRFLSSESRSAETFNLWVPYFRRAALLGPGENAISYSLQKAGRVVGEGAFSATVERGEPLTCSHQSYQSENPDDCQLGQICRRYFRDNGDCLPSSN